MTEQSELAPFHETIVDAISMCHNKEQMMFLASLIVKTKIPKNHDEIVVAWKNQKEKVNWGENDLSVTASILQQKKASVVKNPIIEFVTNGGDISSEEGQKIINDSEKQTIRDAMEDSAVKKTIIISMNESSNPYYRKKIMSAFDE